MNVYHAKFMTYFEIHRMSRDGHSISQISNYLGINRRTVSKYLSMNEQDYEAFLIRQSERSSILDQYEGFIVSKLKQFADTSCAQMHDWLKEHHPDFPSVNAKTIFNFVSRIREKHNIPRIGNPRQCMIVEELPFGLQAQADFGEYNMRNTLGKRVKVSFLAIILSRSRYKYVWFVEGYFTTELSIEGHERGFTYFDGIPRDMVYDQDKVFLVNENKGDLILTERFLAYTREKGFNFHFCRKADPQSKGKVENLVKYVKQNFLYNRTFHNIETLNEEAMGWLGRTANALPHAFTRKAPVSQWHIEQPFLAPHVPYLTAPAPILQMAVRKDNTISYKGNYYSLPLGTYKGRGTWVDGRIDKGHLILTARSASSSNEAGKELCRHVIAEGGGLKIINTDHKRDKTSAIDEMIEQVSRLLNDPEQGKRWLNCIRDAKPRYIRDQLLIVRKTIEEAGDPVSVCKAVRYCEGNNITSATDFKSILFSYQQEMKDQQPTAKIVCLNPLNGQMPDAALNSPEKSAIKDYDAIILAKRSSICRTNNNTN
jgi:transposase